MALAYLVFNVWIHNHCNNNKNSLIYFKTLMISVPFSTDIKYSRPSNLPIAHNIEDLMLQKYLDINYSQMWLHFKVVKSISTTFSYNLLYLLTIKW